MTASNAEANVAKLRGFAFLSVTQFAGCDPTGATSSLTAFSSAYSAAAAGERIQIPPGTYMGVTSVLTGTKFVVWEADGTSVEGTFGGWVLPGVVVQGLAGAGGTETVTRLLTTGTDPATFEVIRSTTHTGGASTLYIPTFTAHSIVTAGVTNLEGAIQGLLENYATATSSTNLNYAATFTGVQNSTGGTGGINVVAQDTTLTVNPGSPLGTIQAWMYASGGDSHSQRVIIDTVGYVQPGGALPAIYCGIRIGPGLGNVNNCTYTNALYMYGNLSNGVNIAPVSGVASVLMSGTSVYGIDMSGQTQTVGMRLKDGTPISFNTANSRQLSWVNGAVPGLTYSVNGTAVSSFTDTGGAIFTGTIAFGSGLTAGSASAGSASALPGAPAGYLLFNITGTNYKLPYWNN